MMLLQNMKSREQEIQFQKETKDHLKFRKENIIMIAVPSGMRTARTYCVRRKGASGRKKTKTKPSDYRICSDTLKMALVGIDHI